MKHTARVWKFGDNINTDLILPIVAFYMNPAEQSRYVFSANRPGWVDLVQPGDIIIGGKNFGMGSSRPAARSLRTLQLGCLVASSINGLFFRNTVNWALPALECPGVDELFNEGDIAEVDFDEGIVRNLTQGTSLKAQPVPQQLVDIVEAGGVYELLEKQGLIAPKVTTGVESIAVKVVPAKAA
jgi:3-isopropylmalate/(R)-2-methylmalate dehydratase small subunit